MGDAHGLREDASSSVEVVKSGAIQDLVSHNSVTVIINQLFFPTTTQLLPF